MRNWQEGTELCEKATPGPWKTDKNLGCKSIKGDKAGTWKQAQYKKIAYTVGLNDEKEDLANTLLMAAAPELLVALEDMLSDYESQNGENYCECDDSVNFVCSACRARKAIAKAKKD